MSNFSPKISIIFPSYNGEKFICDNIESIQKASNLNEIELVIVDNNSQDLTKELIKSFKHLNINLIELDHNVGYAKACNIGVLNAKGKYIFITNQDMIFPKEFFKITLNLFEKLEKTHDLILCPASVFHDGKSINYFGAKIHFLGFSYSPEMYKKLPENKITFKTQKAPGGTMFLKRKTFFKLNGFDEFFFMYHEDTDFSLRALRNNIPIYTTNETSIIHVKHEFKLSDFTYYYIERNRYICIYKNIENLRKLIPYIIISEVLLLFQALLTKKLGVRFKIYRFFIQNYKSVKQLRINDSKCKVQKLNKKQLSLNLDNVLLGELVNNNWIFKFFIKLINLIL